MTMDRTLKSHGGLSRSRSVLTRAERIALLSEEGKFDPETDSPFGLAKVRIRRSRAGQKTKKAAEAPVVEGAEGQAAAEGAETPAAKSEKGEKSGKSAKSEKS